ncbi:phage tail terminator protein [Methyloversatilis sp.]|uniref:phage tail terminator protein n=1 Tax=Methyloversatilis sp. TaxID=2569862 RepID=UPI003D2E1CF6
MFADHQRAIAARLKSKMPEGVAVIELDEAQRVPELRQMAPAVFIAYDGLAPVSEAGQNGRIVQVRHEWLIVCTAQSAAGAGDNYEAKVEAGRIAERVISALAGHHLGEGKYLHLSESPGPEVESGYCWLPLAFHHLATMRGDP